MNFKLKVGVLLNYTGEAYMGILVAVQITVLCQCPITAILKSFLEVQVFFFIFSISASFHL